MDSTADPVVGFDVVPVGWEAWDGGQLDPDSQLSVCCYQDAHETITAAWTTVMRDAPLPDEVMAAARENLLDGGAQGIPWIVVMFNVDPREAIAAALDDGSPRTQARRAMFLASLDAAIEYDEPTYEYWGGTGTLPQFLNATERMIRASRRGRVVRWDRVRRLRSQRARERRSARGPPERPDDDPDLTEERWRR